MDEELTRVGNISHEQEDRGGFQDDLRFLAPDEEQGGTSD